MLQPFIITGNIDSQGDLTGVGTQECDYQSFVDWVGGRFYG